MILFSVHYTLLRLIVTMETFPILSEVLDMISAVHIYSACVVYIIWKCCFFLLLDTWFLWFKNILIYIIDVIYLEFLFMVFLILLKFKILCFLFFFSPEENNLLHILSFITFLLNGSDFVVCLLF